MAANVNTESTNKDVLYRSGSAIIHLRNEFYGMAYRRLMITLVVSFIFNGVMLAILIWLLQEITPPVYFPTDPDGKLLTKVPVNRPYLSEEEVKVFSVKAALAATSYDYLNFRADLQRSREYFTDKGFDRYIAALNKSRNLETVKQEKLVAKGELDGEISIRNTFIGGRYVWYVDIPMRVRYQGLTLKIIQPVTMHLLVGRVPSTESLQRVQVAQMWAEDRQETKAVDDAA